MNRNPTEKPALLIIDMVKDNFDEKRNLPITGRAKALVAPINRLSRAFREAGWPVVFATDAFRRDDFLFQGKLSPHSLQGTEGAEPIDALERRAGDLWLPKPRFSAFFKTGLEDWLRERKVTLCAVAGITTNFCVLTTAMDAVCSDFKAVILEDCATASLPGVHEKTLDLYRRNVLYPLLRVLTTDQLLAEFHVKE